MSQNNRKKRKKRNPWVSLITKLAIVMITLIIASFFFQIKAVHTNEMFPSLRDGDLIFTTNLMPYSFNDIVLYRIPETKEQHYGRIICLEHNDVEITDESDLLVNGNRVDTHNYYQSFDKGSIRYPHHVPDNSMFLLSDYRIELNDSRIYGSIPSKNIIGKVLFVFRIRGF